VHKRTRTQRRVSAGVCRCRASEAEGEAPLARARQAQTAAVAPPHLAELARLAVAPRGGRRAEVLGLGREGVRVGEAHARAAARARRGDLHGEAEAPAAQARVLEEDRAPLVRGLRRGEAVRQLHLAAAEEAVEAAQRRVGPDDADLGELGALGRAEADGRHERAAAHAAAGVVGDALVLAVHGEGERAGVHVERHGDGVAVREGLAVLGEALAAALLASLAVAPAVRRRAEVLLVLVEVARVDHADSHARAAARLVQTHAPLDPARAQARVRAERRRPLAAVPHSRAILAELDAVVRAVAVELVHVSGAQPDVR